MIYMFKKLTAGIVCGVMAASFMTACGKTLSVKDAANAPYGVHVANFEAPKDGDTVVTLNIKDYGAVKIRLFPEYAEKGVENFVGLAEKGYYNGLTFHRVISDFMIQGGDPEGTGRGGDSLWGGNFDGGTSKDLIHAAGAVAYANSKGPTTNSSQFYIVTGTKYNEAQLNDVSNKYSKNFGDEAKKIYADVGGDPWLDGGYTVFGQVYEGLDIVFKIQNVSVDSGNSKPMKDVVIESAEVGKYSGEELKWYISDYNQE